MTIEWSAQARQAKGSGASRRLKKSGMIPAIIYGGQEQPISVALAENMVVKAFLNQDIFNTIIKLDIDGKNSTEVVIKDVQRHPARGSVIHIDLQRTNANKPITKIVPLAFVGEAVSPGVKRGALMTFLVRSVEIRCLAKDLPTSLEVDVSQMEAGTNMRLSELKLPAGITMTALTHGNANYDQAIVKVSKAKG